MAEQAIIELKGINKSFGGVHALKNVDLTINKGEIHALAGENGSGKSTLIKVLCGVHQPDSGTIRINGEECGKMTPLMAIKKGIQVIYQDFSVFPNLSVIENIAFNSEIMRRSKVVSKKRMRETAQQAVDRIGFHVDLDEKVGNLCVADKQLVAISRALLHDAKLIIMDEPTTALTRKEVDKLFEIIAMLKKEGIAILFVSHKTDEVFEISERYTILRSGEKIITGDVPELKPDDFAYYMTGRHFTYDETAAALPGNTIFEARGIGRKNEFQNVSFCLRKGEILCIAGLLGSGRTELAKALFGIEPVGYGELLMEGKPVHIQSVQDAMKNKIAYVPEDRLTEGLFLQQSIYYNEVIGNIRKYTGRLGALDQKRMEADSMHWVQEMTVNTSDMHRMVSTLSGGNQQKVILGRWLATSPKVLILNGPTVGVDIGAKFDIHKLLRKLAQSDMGILIISDDIPEIFACSDRVLVMKNGVISDSFNTAEINEKTLARAMFEEEVKA